MQKCGRGATATVKSFPFSVSEAVSLPMTKRGVLSVGFSFNITANLVSAHATGALTFVPSDKSKQKRSFLITAVTFLKYTLRPPSTADYEAGQSVTDEEGSLMCGLGWSDG